jgi:hypothetical protein
MTGVPHRACRRLRLLLLGPLAVSPLVLGPLALGALALGALAQAPSARATPAVTLKIIPIPIPGFPGTGNRLGAGAEIEAQATISGTEYGGYPSPLVGMNIYAPSGVKITPTGFGSCAPSTLEVDGPAACSRSSRAGPTGEGLGVVAFGGEPVDEKVSIHEFFSPEGLIFYVEGRSPASFQIIEKAHWAPASGQFDLELFVEIPLVETLPGADDASVLSFKVRVGAAYRKAGRTVSYITLPKRCPRGGFPVKAEMQFMNGETVTVAYKQVCPKHN